MKKIFNAFRPLPYAILATLALLGAVQAQLTSESSFSAPFDLSDRYYSINGVEPDALIDRRDGHDRRSVIDFSFDRNHRDVRITQTFSGTNSEGKMIFYNHFADLNGQALKYSAGGGEAAGIAFRYPIYMFPSSTLAGQFRQSAILTTDADYFEKNPLGLALVILIEYNDYARTKQGRSLLREKLGKRSMSIDGDPVILNASEISALLRAGLITQKIRGAGSRDSGTTHIVAKQIPDPRFGAITLDAFLVSTTNPDGTPLEADREAIEQFRCLQTTGDYCN